MNENNQNSQVISINDLLSPSNVAANPRTEKHYLPDDWTLWALANITKDHKEPAQNHRVASFSTIEEFWAIYNSLTEPSKWKGKRKIIFCRSDVEPTWEDPQNINGGEWIMYFTNMNVDKIFLDILLFLISGTSKYSESTTSIWLHSGGQHKRIAIWNNSSDDEQIQEFGKSISDMIPSHSGKREMTYTPFKSYIEKPENSRNVVPKFTINKQP